jgi:hypothetical protein
LASSRCPSWPDGSNCNEMRSKRPQRTHIAVGAPEWWSRMQRMRPARDTGNNSPVGQYVRVRRSSVSGVRQGSRGLREQDVPRLVTLRHQRARPSPTHCRGKPLLARLCWRIVPILQQENTSASESSKRKWSDGSAQHYRSGNPSHP